MYGGKVYRHKQQYMLMCFRSSNSDAGFPPDNILVVSEDGTRQAVFWIVSDGVSSESACNEQGDLSQSLVHIQ